MRPLRFLFPFVLLLAGCGGPKRVSGEAFQGEYELRNHQTVTASEYLGEKDGRVYLLRTRMPLLGKRWKEEVWFVDTADLSPVFLERLRSESGNRQFAAVAAPALAAPDYAIVVSDRTRTDAEWGKAVDALRTKHGGPVIA